jgi:hypothetical protein
VADAGADQCLVADAATANVLLDASATVSSTGDVKRFLWHVPSAEPCEFLEGQTVTVDLPPGLHSIELSVTDQAGNTSRDTVLVEVD